MSCNPGASADLAPAPLSRLISYLLVSSLDIRSLWSLEHCPGGTTLQPGRPVLLAFADLAALRNLRKQEDPHRGDVELLVVTDGERFQTAWGASRLSGSLARLAWRQVSAHEAYYDEARWAAGGGPGGEVVRIRRKARLLWPEPLSAHQFR